MFQYRRTFNLDWKLMMRSDAPINVANWSQADMPSRYDLAIATLGYEDRSAHFWRHVRPEVTSSVAYGFLEQEELSFRKNLTFYKEAGFTVTSPSGDEYRAALSAALLASAPNQDVTRVVIDISSLTRDRIAMACECFEAHAATRAVEVDFVYYLAAFQSPAKRIKQNAYAGPVLPSFAGWWRYPELPVAAIVGLGYEENKALGAVELLQVPEATWTFMPESTVKEYDAALLLANEALLSRVPNDHVITYIVEDPFQTYKVLAALRQSLSELYNVVLLPFGPKIFGLASILVAINDHHTAVWRISAGIHAKPREAYAHGDPFGLRVRFGCRWSEVVNDSDRALSKAHSS
jgi:hypothetical protein